MTKAFALKISMKALFFFVVFLQYNKNRGRLTDLLDSLFSTLNLFSNGFVALLLCCHLCLQATLEHFALLALLAFALHSPIFLKLPKLSPYRMGHYGQSQTPGQGQDTRRYLLNAMSLLSSKSLLSSESSESRVIRENAFWALSPF